MSLKKILILSLFILPMAAFSQQLVYRPTNPAFGGDTFNYQWLLNSANAQNGFTDPNAGSASNSNSDLDRFTENLNRQLLNSISRDLFDQQFSEDGLQPGTFTFGSLEVEVIEGLNGLVINILDTNNGEQTQIIVPN
ncbi:curli production assembly/transport component CsgF [Patiriisocius sp. Uisw_017]|jgi:curli production assembly/transport component CsgF|uniref:curli production assembly/transport component CsgF n=1 Tax=Patiriisocius sp. Uisw_017 TaxID=3230968 RepID=UPI0039E73D74